VMAYSLRVRRMYVWIGEKEEGSEHWIGVLVAGLIHSLAVSSGGLYLALP